jgi:hypothetical protein
VPGHALEDLLGRPLTGGDQRGDCQYRDETSMLGECCSHPQGKNASAKDDEHHCQRYGTPERHTACDDIEGAQLSPVVTRIELGRERHDDLEELHGGQLGQFTKLPRKRIRGDGSQGADERDHDLARLGPKTTGHVYCEPR